MDIIVPCKGLSAGKSRLRECLGSHDRRELCEWLLVSTLRAADKLVGARRVHVVTSDAEADAIGRHHGMRCIGDPGFGLNEALDVARATLLAEGRASLMVLPIDLPYADAQALANVAACAGDMVIASDERGSGTNVLLMRAAAARRVPFAFGDGSFAAHLASARTLGLSSQIVRDGRLAFDIDEPAQYVQWRGDCGPAAGTMRHAPDGGLRAPGVY
jgi:2-phospho-L-lactate guanylyltransferase